MSSFESTPSAGLAGLRVCSFESRKGNEMRSLLERQGALVTIAPSMREIPLNENPEAFAFADRLFAGEIDMVIFMTGVGTRALADTLETRYDRSRFLDALQRATLVVRGPKPAAVLREWKCRIDHIVPEPNTWRELLTLLDERLPPAGKTVAVQEYGQPNEELYEGLASRGAHVVRVPVYRWALPDDTRPLESAIRATISGAFDVILFTSANQLTNVLAIADTAGLRSDWLAAARKCVVASIGPTASEFLEQSGLRPDIEPEHPKMGHLVLAVAASAREILSRKRPAGS
jgi:uroporphyrinogen-III synthase